MKHLVTHRLFTVGCFFTVTMLAGLLVAISGDNGEFLFYAAAMLLIAVLVAVMDRRVGFSRIVLWGLALWGALHLAGGLMAIPQSITEQGTDSVLYNMRLHPWLPKYDQFVHAFGFGIATITVFEALRRHLGGTLKPTLPVLAIAFLSGLGLGCVNEIIEFTAVLLMPDTNVGGYENTGWDLVSNAVGALTAIIVLRWNEYRNRVSHFKK